MAARPPADIGQDEDSKEVLKNVEVDGTVGTAIGDGVLGEIALDAANVSLFVASTVMVPLAMIGWVRLLVDSSAHLCRGTNWKNSRQIKSRCLQRLFVPRRVRLNPFSWIALPGYRWRPIRHPCAAPENQWTS